MSIMNDTIHMNEKKQTQTLTHGEVVVWSHFHSLIPMVITQHFLMPPQVNLPWLCCCAELCVIWFWLWQLSLSWKFHPCFCFTLRLNQSFYFRVQAFPFSLPLHSFFHSTLGFCCYCCRSNIPEVQNPLATQSKRCHTQFSTGSASLASSWAVVLLILKQTLSPTHFIQHSSCRQRLTQNSLLSCFVLPAVLSPGFLELAWSPASSPAFLSSFLVFPSTWLRLSQSESFPWLLDSDLGKKCWLLFWVEKKIC